MKKKLLTLLCLTALTCSLLAGCQSTESKTETSAASAVSSGSDVASEAESMAEASSSVLDSTVSSAAETQAPAAALEDGTYTAEFTTDSSMFHVSEACEGKGTLTVKDGEMVIHVSLGSKKIVNLYPGLAEDAQKDGAELLQPTTDTVTYSDGMTDEVYGFDVPVPALDQEFDLALVGTKGKWYDHKVMVSNPEKQE